jgi:tetratricopeptide (TPR) repeat protein
MFMGGKVGFFLPMIVLFFVFNAMRNKENKNRQEPRSRQRDRDRSSYDTYQRRRRDTRSSYEERRRPSPPPRPRSKPKPRPVNNSYKTSGVQKYKDYDYDGAIEDFKKALEINASDIPTHFNIACAYSLTEQKDLAYKHIDLAVRLGFKDFEKIRTHDAFAYIRIQDDFEAFEENGFQVSAKTEAPPSSDNAVDTLLLERLRKLSELRDRGILTEEEFVIQKEKLLR